MTVIDNRVRRIDKYTPLKGIVLTGLGTLCILALGFGVWYFASSMGKAYPECGLSRYAGPIGSIAMLFIHWKGLDLWLQFWFNSGVTKVAAWLWKFMICFTILELIIRLMNQFCPQVLPECLQEDVHVSKVQVVIEDHTQPK